MKLVVIRSYCLKPRIIAQTFLLKETYDSRDQSVRINPAKSITYVSDDTIKDSSGRA